MHLSQPVCDAWAIPGEKCQLSHLGMALPALIGSITVCDVSVFTNNESLNFAMEGETSATTTLIPTKTFFFSWTADICTGDLSVKGTEGESDKWWENG